LPVLWADIYSEIVTNGLSGDRANAMLNLTKLDRRVRDAILVFCLGLGFWIVVCLADSSWYMMVGFSKGKPITWGEILFKNLPYWLGVSILTPFVAAFSRWAWSGGRFLWRTIGAHLLGVIPFAILHVILVRGYYFSIKGAPIFSGQVWPLFSKDFYFAVRQYLSTRLDYEILLYAVVVIAVTAFDYYRRFREKEKTTAELELEQARLQASLSEAKLDALKIQLQPHFLFNSLHAISTLILRGDSKTANKMLLHLSHFLRMTLDSTDSQEVPLAVELEFLDAYLRIQRVRFGDRLDIRMNIDEETLAIGVPNLLLQPLVENAIRHGIGSDPGSGLIEISTSRENDRLRLEVIDNGIGLQDSSSLVEGVGLGNIKARLAQLYPDDFSFQLIDAPNKGTIASVTIPIRQGAMMGARKGADHD